MTEITDATLVPIAMAIALAVGSVAIVLWLNRKFETVNKNINKVKDMAQDNRKDIDSNRNKMQEHGQVHKELEVKIELLRKAEEKIIEDMGGLKTDIASLNTKIDILLDHFKKNK